MTRFGTHMRWTAPESERQALHRMFTVALGCSHSAPTEALDLFHFAGGEIIGIYFGEPALSVEDMGRGAWLEFLVADVEATRAALGEVGLEPFPYVDEAHPYFRAPGGQVFRLATG